MIRLFCLLIWTPLVFVLSPSAAHADVQQKLAAHVRSLKAGDQAKLAVALYDLRANKQVFDYNGTELLCPASLQKLFTTYVALQELGSGYRFSTEVYVDKEKNGVAALFLKGGGDPTLTSERLWEIAEAVKLAGVRSVTRIVLDDSAFREERGRSGAEPYQAEQSALSFNYNSIRIAVYPTSAGKSASVAANAGAPVKIINTVQTVSGSRQNIALSAVQESAGEWQCSVSGEIGERAAPFADYRSAPSSRRYLGATLAWMLERVGVEVRSAAEAGAVAPHAQLIGVFKSRDLAQILSDLNHLSSNFIAGQIVYALGGQGANFSFVQGLERMRAILSPLGIHGAEFFDGSGLDRRNRTSAVELLKVLVAAYRDLSIAPDYLASLSRYGVSGTLRRRDFKHEQARTVWAKTGSLNGVSGLAGYFEGKSGARYAFVILSNGIGGRDEAQRVEDQIVRVMLDEG